MTKTRLSGLGGAAAAVAAAVVAAVVVVAAAAAAAAAAGGEGVPVSAVFDVMAWDQIGT